LTSAAAEISILGSTDLVAQTFDYTFAVRPGVSKTLPVIGAIAGGPVGAAADLALQGLLRDALGEAAEAVYSIRGPWADPTVERVDKPPKKKSTTVSPGSTGPVGETPETEPDVPPEETQDAEAGATGQQSTEENNND